MQRRTGRAAVAMIGAHADDGERAMTSGQGGSGSEQGGRSPQPPYGGGQPQQPPEGGGWPPQGQPPYGYYAAPSATAGPPPEPMERPLTVRAGLGAFVASILLSLASVAFMAADWDTYLRQAMAQQPEFGTADPEALEFAQAAAESLAIAFVVIGILFAALYLLFVWFAWTGRNWARIVLWILGGFGILSGLTSLAAGAALPSLTVLAVFQTLALVVGVVLLALKPSNDWFRHEKWRRAVTGPR